MGLLVPFDGSALSEAALVRARELSELFDEDVITVTVIPAGNTEYAQKKGWIESDEEFNKERIITKLRDQIHDLHPNAQFTSVEVVSGTVPGSIASRVREKARNMGIEMIIIGSENAGRITSRVSIVGEAIADDDTYDVLIVRHELDSQSG